MRTRFSAVVLGLMVVVLMVSGVAPAVANADTSAPAPLSSVVRPTGPLVPAVGALLGAFVDPDGSGYSQDKILGFEEQIGRQLSIDMRYYGLNDAFPSQLDRWTAQSGRIPLITWEPFDTTLNAFLAGQHDELIRRRARDVKALGSPIFLRFAHEMNGDWYPWSGVHNHDRGQTNGPDKYIAAWRRVHDLFAAEGATNAVWVWSPNAGSVPHHTTHPWNDWKRYYPGDAYVDWVAIDGYNWGSTQSWSSWTSFEQIFRPVYDDYATRKPIMIGEFASAEQGGNKAAWINDLLPTIRDRFPAIAAIVWFQMNKETDWRVDSSPASLLAFRTLAADPYFGGSGVALPGPVTGLTAAPGLRRAALSWTNPTEASLARVVVRMAAGATPPASPTSGTGVLDALGSSVTATGLTAGDHSFSVFAVDVNGNASPAASVTLRGTALTRAASASQVNHGAAVTISGRLTQALDGAGLGGRAVRLLVRPRGTSTWTAAATVTSASDGTVQARHTPAWNAEYALRFAGAGSHLGVNSQAVAVNVRQTVSAALSASRITLGSTVTLSGTVAPAHPGNRVLLQQRVDGVWHNVTRATLSSTSTYRFSIKPTTRGTFEYRVRRPASDTHTAGTSPIRTLQVR